MAIGRLDRNSEGLLLLTTDGKVSYDILSHKYEKEYYVQVDGSITEEAIQQLKEGVKISLEGAIYKTMPCEAKLMGAPKRFPIENRTPRDARHGPMSWISIILREGKYRQVRKMTAAVGFPTLRLIRVRIGTVKLTLPTGAVHPLELLNDNPHFK
jgi:23S rRNA pseudouridine2457 synthase